jgi:hypothetical protein
MRRHFSSSRRRRRELLAEANDPPPHVAHLHVTLSGRSRAQNGDKIPLRSDLSQLRARLLRMIVANESARRTTKTLG